MEEHTDVPAVETELTLDEIIAQLDAPYTGKLPEAALRAAQRRRDEIAPRLIECIERATETVRAGERPKGEAHFFALFLLTEFRCREAWPAIVAAVSLPDDGGYELFDDVITEVLPRTLTVLAGDSRQLLQELAANRSLDMFVRWAALSGNIHLVRDGRMTREEAIEIYRGHLRDAIANQDGDLASIVVSDLVNLAPREALEDIAEAFRLQLVDETLVDLAYVERAAAGGEEWVQHELARCTPTDIEDAVEELSRWHAFREDSMEAEGADWDADEYSDVALRDDWSGGFDDEEDDSPLSSTIRRDAPRIGRNDPCPCGSGKKYKKCCGRGKGLSID